MHRESLLSLITAPESRPGKKEVEYLAHEVCADPLFFDAVYDRMLLPESETEWYAAWVLDKASRMNHNLFSEEKIKQLIDAVQVQKRSGMQRLMLTIIYNSNASPALDVGFLNFCYDTLLSSKTAIAVRALAVKILCKMSRVEPELSSELQLTLESLDPELFSPGFRSIRQKTLKLLSKRA